MRTTFVCHRFGWGTSLFTTVVLQMGLHSWQTENNNVQKLPGYPGLVLYSCKSSCSPLPREASTARQMQINAERIQTVQIKDRAGAVWAQSFSDGRKINRFLQHVQIIFTFCPVRVLCWEIRLLPVGGNFLLYQNVTNAWLFWSIFTLMRPYRQAQLTWM